MFIRFSKFYRWSQMVDLNRKQSSKPNVKRSEKGYYIVEVCMFLNLHYDEILYMKSEFYII